MRIIEKKDCVGWTYTCTCGTCESRLEAELADIEYTPESGGSQHDYYVPEQFYIKCPVCAHSIWVPENYMSNYVRIKVRDRNQNKHL